MRFLTLVLSTAVMLARGTEVPRYEPSGQQSAPTAVPHRIISLVPAVTEMLFAMGDGANVVGVSSYDHYPPQATTRPKVGALVDPDVERMLSLRPDLVIVYSTQTDLIARLARAHVPMFSYEHAGLPDITATFRLIGARVGHASEADRLATGIEQALAGIRARVAGKPRPKTLIVIGREEGSLRDIYASAGIGFLHDMLIIAGGDDVLGELKRQSVQASTEVILTHQPDVIIELRVVDWNDVRQQRDLDMWRALPSLPAVRTNRLFMFGSEMMVIPGPRVAEATRILAKALHPEAFSQAAEVRRSPSS